MTWEEYPAPSPAPEEPRPTLATVAVGGVLILAMLGLLILGASFAGRTLREAFGSDRVIVAGQPVTIEIPAGATAADIGDLLVENDVIASDDDFTRTVRDRQLESSLQAGVFALQTGMPVDEVVEVLLAPQSSEITVRVVEGLTLEDTLARLSDFTAIPESEFEAALLDGSVTSSLLPEPADELRDWEGLLFPDTYLFLDDATAAEILQRLADTMELRVQSVDWSRLPELGLTQYEAIVLASLVEEEVKIPEERPVVASVIYNRLESGWPLQIDATIQYALPERKAALSLDDLQIDSPYNSYQNRGLPPTPISGVGLASLQAAANPADTDFFYYVLTSADGRHSFAETEEEFLRFKEQAREDGLLGP